MEEKDRAAMTAYLREVMEDYAERIREAPIKLREERDAKIRQFARENGLRAVDVEDMTKLSRETVRQILRPETRPAPKSGQPAEPPAKVTRPRKTPSK